MDKYVATLDITHATNILVAKGSALTQEEFVELLLEKSPSVGKTSEAEKIFDDLVKRGALAQPEEAARKEAEAAAADAAAVENELTAPTQPVEGAENMDDSQAEALVQGQSAPPKPRKR